jgi:hypothetical protein
LNPEIVLVIGLSKSSSDLPKPLLDFSLSFCALDSFFVSLATLVFEAAVFSSESFNYSVYLAASSAFVVTLISTSLVTLSSAIFLVI